MKRSSRGFSERVVRVHLGLGLAIAGAVAAGLLLVDLVAGWGGWCGLVFALASLALSLVSLYLGIFGVIRYGLFTEGCGAVEVRKELELSRVAYLAGGVGQVTLLVAIVLTLALIVRQVV